MFKAHSFPRLTFGSPTTLGGAMIVAGTSIGAGMFSLPMISGGVWFFPAALLLCLTAYCLYSSGLYLSEVTFKHPKGYNYTSLAKSTLGTYGQIAAILSVSLVCYTLIYSYISGGASVISYTAETLGFATISAPVASTIFVVFLGSIVYLGSYAVDRLLTVMIGGMLFTFGLSWIDLTQNFSLDKLSFIDLSSNNMSYFGSILPIFVVSFGFHASVPSLAKHFDYNSTCVIRSIRYGILFTLFIYLSWMLSVFGSLHVSDIAQAMIAGGNIDDLLRALNGSRISDYLEGLLQTFANLALSSSFLGVALGLFDFISDLFKVKETHQGRIKVLLFVLIPPLLLSILFPYGFLKAIGYAALVATIFLVILPCMMAKSARRKMAYASNDFRVSGGKQRLTVILGIGWLAFIFELCVLMNLLPMFPSK